MIETQRFILRKFTIFDAEAMFKNWASDEDVTKYLSWDTHMSIDDTINYLNFVIETNQSCYAIVDKKTKEVIGSIANVKENADFTVCDVGYCLGKKYWNQGILTEVLFRYLEELFINRGYKIVEASFVKENYASGQVMNKCGMHFLYKSLELKDKLGWVEIKHYAITKKDFIMKKLSLDISNYLGTQIPSFYDINDLMLFLQTKGFFVKSITTIDNNKIFNNHRGNIYVGYQNDLNIRQYYFISERKNAALFDAVIKEFLYINKEYIISDSNKKLEQLIVNLLKEKNLTISFAESCTGGLLTSTLINVSGASNVIKESYVTYSNEAKIKNLGVKEKTINTHSVYSKEVALEMARGLFLRTGSNICVSVTGLAGGLIHEANDGSYDYAIYLNYKKKENVIVEHKKEKGLRNEVRRKQVNYIFYQIYKNLNNLDNF